VRAGQGRNAGATCTLARCVLPLSYEETSVSETVDITLERFEAGAELFEVAQRVYARTWPEDDADEIRASFEEYAGYRDFIGLLAYLDGEPVGVSYGAAMYPGVPYHDQLAMLLGTDHAALQATWRLVELAVVPEAQGRGVGGRLHDALLAAQPYPRALIATAVSNERARDMYLRRGWSVIAPALHLPGKREAHIIFARKCQPCAGSPPPCSASTSPIA
jgi:GNAT superfamily N-acetyltransferase